MLDNRQNGEYNRKPFLCLRNKFPAHKVYGRFKIGVSKRQLETITISKQLFSENEKINLLNSKNPQFTVWLFWSMKEAVYKANQRS